MGFGGTVDFALERAAVMRAAIGLALASAALAGCAAFGDVTGAVAGLVSGAATANPAVGISVGIAVRAGTNEALDRIAVARRRNEQDAIAAVAADLNPGDTGAWAVDQQVAGDARGEVRVLRVIETPLAFCKELAFSVVGEKDGQPEWFATTACRVGETWQWAGAEPAVSRWTNLQ